jgi:hypothetical protein
MSNRGANAPGNLSIACPVCIGTLSCEASESGAMRLLDGELHAILFIFALVSTTKGRRMKKRFMVPLFVVIAVAVSLPAGFAIADAVSGGEAERPPITRTDPDPRTDPIAQREALEAAWESGDPAAEEKAANALREEMQSRMAPDERQESEAAPPEVDLPPSTYAYVSPAVTPFQIEQCREHLKVNGDDRLCQLIVMYGEGKARAGAYTLEQADQAVATERSAG